MSEKLLSEYQNVLKELDAIKNKTTIIKTVTQNRLKCAKNESEKKTIFLEFKNQLRQMKKDHNIKHQYKNLMKQKKFLESEMLDKMSSEDILSDMLDKTFQDDITSINPITPRDDIRDDVTDLINKYKKNIIGTNFDPTPNTTIIVNIPHSPSPKRTPKIIQSSSIDTNSDEKCTNDTQQKKYLRDLIKDLECDLDGGCDSDLE